MTPSVLAQLDQIFELASKGATLGGQGLLIVGMFIAGYVIRKMHTDNKEQTRLSLTAHERQHAELVGMLTAERETHKSEREHNHETLVRIATESATGLQATATAITGLTTSMNSMRETFHAIRGDMQKRSYQREIDETHL